MIKQDALLMAIKKAMFTVPTKHLILVDKKTFKGDINSVNTLFTKHRVSQYRHPFTKKIMRYEWDEPSVSNKVAWFEPVNGIYIIDMSIIIHFQNYLDDNIIFLLQNIVNTGFYVKSIRFGKIKKQNTLNIKKINKNNKVKIAIFAMFSSKGLVEYWERFLLRTKLPENVVVDVIVGDNTGQRYLQNPYKKYKAHLKNKYNNFYYTELDKIHIINPEDHYLEIKKHAHVAVIYSKVLIDIVDHYDYILKIEDDIEPPDDGLVRLYEHMKHLIGNGKKIAAIGGYYPQKIDPDTICVSLQPEIWGKVPKVAEMQPRLFRVEMQGGGFTFYNTAALKEVLPYTLTFKTPHGNAYMTGWDGTIGEKWSENGWEQYCDGSMYCIHHI